MAHRKQFAKKNVNLAKYLKGMCKGEKLQVQEAKGGGK
jgi:hypothetical protein